MPGAMMVGDAQERWTFGFLFDIILTRDPFMHRLDISRATGVPSRPHARTRVSSSMTSSANGPPYTAAPTR